VYALGLALAVVIGVSLGFFGGGGSILTVPLLVYVFGLPPKQAIATSLLVVATASITGALQHWRAGNVRLRTAGLFGASGMLGAYTGGRAAAFVDGALLLLLFAAMMLLTATAMWRGRRAPGAHAAEDARSALRLVAQGGAVGLFTGLVGAGGGFLIVPALALWAGLPMQAAVGTSLVVIVMNTLAGYAGYANHVRIDPALVAAVAATAVAGSFAGARFAQRVDPTSLRKAFAGFVLAMAALVLVREAGTWLAVVRAALPHSAGQLVLVLLALAVGVAAGRASHRAAEAPYTEPIFEQGAGI
jgi:hypothetical protein